MGNPQVFSAEIGPLRAAGKAHGDGSLSSRGEAPQHNAFGHEQRPFLPGIAARHRGAGAEALRAQVERGPSLR